MVTFEEAASMLDEAVDALPQEIFDKLNGGVNLIPARRTDEHGLLVMGMYFVDQMGRHVEIYYGSFKERFHNAPPERWKRELTRTLKHELTHHIENLAYDRSLEKWDAEHVAKLLSGLEDEPLGPAASSLWTRTAPAWRRWRARCSATRPWTPAARTSARPMLARLKRPRST